MNVRELREKLDVVVEDDLEVIVWYDGETGCTWPVVVEVRDGHRGLKYRHLAIGCP